MVDGRSGEKGRSKREQLIGARRRQVRKTTRDDQRRSRVVSRVGTGACDVSPGKFRASSDLTKTRTQIFQGHHTSETSSLRTDQVILAVIYIH
jgi:hypothetical protein